MASQSSGKTQAAFEELQAWCDRMDAIGPTPRLIVDRDWPEGAWGCFEDAPGGPVVKMHPATVQRLHRWLDLAELTRLSEDVEGGYR